MRFLGNRSSGKMGYAVAEEAQRRGARVILVSGPSSLRPPANCELVSVVSAEEMRRAVLSRLDQATIVIKAAAVADYRPQVSGRTEDEADRPDHPGVRADRRHSARSGAAPSGRVLW